jgi:glycyl-tRNA synthetase
MAAPAASSTTPAAAAAAPAEARLRAQVVAGDKLGVDRTTFEELLKRRFFVSPAYSIYGGVAGLYDFGPPGCAVKANLLALWRKHFVLHDAMLEVDCTNLTPKPVLDASGHTAKFSDYMVRDEKTRTCYRADHVLKAHLSALITAAPAAPPPAAPAPAAAPAPLSAAAIKEAEVLLARVDDLKPEELAAALKRYDVRAPETGNGLTDPVPFNLMFQTSIGPAGDLVGFLRPETAQGIFVNFKKLLEFNGSKLPFAAAQIGTAFRNEIAPRSGLLRVREFPLAEIEYFVNPSGKTHAGYGRVKDTRLGLLPAAVQMAGSSELVWTTVGEAVAAKTVGNEALGYFMARTYAFLRTAGIPDNHLRFRQHLRTEMAHYAADCWDAEIRTTYGWIEVVGHADRTCFDLTRHTECSQQNMSVHEQYKDGTRTVERTVMKLNKQAIGKALRKDAQPLVAHLEGLSAEGQEALKREMAESSAHTAVVTLPKGQVTVTGDMVTFEKMAVKETGESFMPHVIEPSYGIGRIIYCLLEHAFWTRPQDKDRSVLSLAPIIAPIKTSLFPLTGDQRLAPIVERIDDLLTVAGISHKTDETGQSIGRRYARTDELGIPFAVTIDFATLENDTVTLRERDSTLQVRIPIAELAATLNQLVDHKITWQAVVEKYPRVVVSEKDD